MKIMIIERDSLDKTLEGSITRNSYKDLYDAALVIVHEPNGSYTIWKNVYGWKGYFNSGELIDINE